MEMENLALHERLSREATFVDTWDAVCKEILLDAKYRRREADLRCRLLERKEENSRLRHDLYVARQCNTLTPYTY
ncbi:hypothetical protein A2U01_0009804 [Trifolium medium]|uniref:Uncharacterized protein n=1 Tax=Trifolium medium TaxID=97028 RepID=A0A392MNH9_9FABA|nr:hypothetical protein [Trifolium medium]